MFALLYTTYVNSEFNNLSSRMLQQTDTRFNKFSSKSLLRILHEYFTQKCLLYVTVNNPFSVKM